MLVVAGNSNTENDISTAERIAKGEMHPALVEAFGLLSDLRDENEGLKAENEELRRKLAARATRITAIC